jgi:D-glycero-D-manno-heptose 1,7-bisphosphate phosphatase
VINPKPISLLCLDIDGTVRHGKDELGRFVNTPADVIVFPEAVEKMRKWKDAGGRIVGVSNQGGIALGHMTMEHCAQAMTRTQELTGGLFDCIAWCRHHPAAKDPLMARCWCRKPSPGLIIEAAHGLSMRFPDEYYPPSLALMVGDRNEDRECARLANIDFQAAAEWRTQP